MTIQEVVNYLNFYVNKVTGAFLTIPECIEALDRGQLSLYSDFKTRYATSQYVKDALSPFIRTANINGTVSGLVTINDVDYLDLLDMQIFYDISNRRVYAPVKMVNEDERANRLSSQRDPVTVTSPIGEQIGLRSFKLYPVASYNGNVTYFRRPAKPVFGYTLISGRVIVYNPLTSTQLEWSEQHIDAIIIKALATLGINLNDADIANYATEAAQRNYNGINRV